MGNNIVYIDKKNNIIILYFFCALLAIFLSAVV